MIVFQIDIDGVAFRPAELRLPDLIGEEPQEPIDRLGDAAMPFKCVLQQRVALRSVERQDPVPNPTACGLRDEAADATQAIGALLCRGEPALASTAADSASTPAPDVATVSITGTSRRSARTASIARNWSAVR